MFNLSDKELDRLSREAASQHDPGDQLMGPGAWERLEARLDKELGGTATPSPNPLRGIRRLPFQYAPVILLIVGVSYYAVRQFGKSKKAEGSGSPPLTVLRSDQAQAGQTNTDPLTKTPANSKNSTPTTEKNTTTPYPDSSDPAGTAATQPGGLSGATGANGSNGAPGATGATGSNGRAGTKGNEAAPGSNTPANHTADATAGKAGGLNHRTPGAGGNAPDAPARTADASGRTAPNGSPYRPGTRNGKADIAAGTNSKGHSSPEITVTTHNRPQTPETTSTHAGAHRGGHNRPGDRPAPSTLRNPGETQDPTAGKNRSDEAADPDLADAALKGNKPDKTTSLRPAEAGLVSIRGPQSLTGHPRISDSSLLAYIPPPAPPTAPGRSLHINRSLQFGLQLAPDFSSVNSLAGDKPGSSIGITVDYQFVNRLYLSTGLLFSKKNYTARIQDCHVPNDYFRINNLHEVDFIKGSMNMLELPLNLRYDFSVTGNTLFFASAGVSSYLMLNQRSDYYYNFFGREAYRRFNYPEKNAYLLSAVNLSLGVETGISNSLSLQVAPYVKLPTRSIGFGEIKMNSVGINFALKFAPVISRKRK